MLSLQYLTLQSLATGLVPASQSSPVIIRITVLTSSILSENKEGQERREDICHLSYVGPGPFMRPSLSCSW